MNRDWFNILLAAVSAFTLGIYMEEERRNQVLNLGR
jgi:hypothetical protein